MADKPPQRAPPRPPPDDDRTEPGVPTPPGLGKASAPRAVSTVPKGVAPAPPRAQPPRAQPQSAARAATPAKPPPVERTTVDRPPSAPEDDATPLANDEPTLVYKARVEQPPPTGPRFVVIAGPKKGAEFAVLDGETTVGRASENAISIADISVSRQHVRLIRAGGGTTLVDLGSGNGTRVNGQKVQKVVLKTGDEVAIGDSTLRYVEPGGVVVKGAKPAAAVPGLASRDTLPPVGTKREATQVNARRKPQTLSPQRRKIYLALGAGLLMILVFGSLRNSKKQKAADSKREAAEQQAEQEIGGALDEVKADIKKEDWAAAFAKAKEAHEAAPDDADVSRYFDTTSAEAPRAAALAEAHKKLASKDFAGVKAALGQVPQESQLADKAADLKKRLDDAVAAQVEAARVKVEGGDAEAALDLLAPVLAADPTRADASAVKDAIDRRLAKGGGSRVREASTTARKSRRAEPVAGPVASPAVDRYVDGDVSGAIGAAQNSGDMRLAHDLSAFRAAASEGETRAQSKRAAEALKPLENALKLDEQIAGGRLSKPGTDVRRQLANMHYLLGVQAKADGLNGKSAEHLRAAVQVDPSNTLAKQQLEKSISEAHELYLRGYIARDNNPDEAKKLFKDVVQMLPPAAEDAQKAKRFLDRLEGKSAAPSSE